MNILFFLSPLVSLIPLGVPFPFASFLFRYAAPRSRSERTKWAVVMSEFAPICIYLVISPLVSLIPLGVPFPFASNGRKYKVLVFRLSILFVFCVILWGWDPYPWKVLIRAICSLGKEVLSSFLRGIALLFLPLLFSLLDPEGILQGPIPSTGVGGVETSSPAVRQQEDFRGGHEPLHMSNGNGGTEGSSPVSLDSFELDVLLEDTPSSSSPGAAGVEVPDNLLRSPPVVPYPYHPDEVIGGDSVSAIEWRLLFQKESPSILDLQQARLDAEDLFEVKVDIIRLMAGLDPEGDWQGRGAHALANPRTSTGEPSLEKLSNVLDDLQHGGVHSDSFKELKDKVFLKKPETDEHSAA